MTKFLLITFAMLSASFAFGQFSTSISNVAAQLANKIKGPGVMVSNPVLTCDSLASGIFSFASVPLNMDNGVVLSNGKVTDLYANQFPTTSFSGVVTPDSQLNSIMLTFDKCLLEFDFISIGDTISINHEFASEEYPTSNCNMFNDCMGIYIKGTFAGSQYPVYKNIAVVPNTNIPICVNSINDSTVSSLSGGNITNCAAMGPGCPFSNYYLPISQPSGLTLNGRTVKFTSTAKVTPYGLYHMKIGVADFYDGLVDSGVFIEGGSFVSNANNFIFTGGNSQQPIVLVEGCDSLSLAINRITINGPVNSDTVKLQLTGPAQNGVDFNFIDTVLTFVSNLADSQKVISIMPIWDSNLEGSDTLLLALVGNSGYQYDSVLVIIKDRPGVQIQSSASEICLGDSIYITGASDTNLNYQWQPSFFVLDSSIGNATIVPIQNTTFTLVSNFKNCYYLYDSFSVVVNSPPSISVQKSDVVCFGEFNGMISCACQDSTVDFQLLPINQIAATYPYLFQNLPAGGYTIIAWDSNMCKTTLPVTVEQPIPLELDSLLITHNYCSQNGQGSAVVLMAGGTLPYSYLLLPDSLQSFSGSFTGLATGAYSILVVDAHGCSVSQAFQINQYPTLNLSAMAISNVTCWGLNNGEVIVNAQGGSAPYSYDLQPTSASNSTGVFSGLSAGVYTLIVNDSASCSDSVLLTVSTPSAFNLSSPIQTANIFCHGDSSAALSCFASGGQSPYQFSLVSTGLSNSLGAFNALWSATYTVLAVDANGCTKTSSINISEPSALSLTTQISNPICHNSYGSVLANGSGGVGPYLYNFDNFSSFTTSNYFTTFNQSAIVTVQDGNGCEYTSSVTFVNPPAINLNAVITTLPCISSTALISATASLGALPYTYSIQSLNMTNNTGQFSVPPGVYTISVEDNNLCQVSTVVVNNAMPPLMLELDDVFDVSCNNTQGVIKVHANNIVGSAYFVLQPGSIINTSGTFSNLATGTYTVEAHDSSNCVADTIISINQASALVIDSNLVFQNFSCQGQGVANVFFSVTGGSVQYSSTSYNYYASIMPNGIQTTGNFFTLYMGTYTLFVTDSVGCNQSIAFTVSPNPYLFDSASIFNQALCGGLVKGSAEIIVSGGSPPYMYNFGGLGFGSSNINANLGPNITYWVVVSDAVNCTISFTYTIPTSPAVNFYTTIVPSSISAGDIAVHTTTGTPPFTFSLNLNAPSSDSILINALWGGVYTVNVTDAYGCSKSAIVQMPLGAAIEMHSFSEQFTVYPNPSHGRFMVDLAKNININSNSIVLKIFDFTGETLAEKSLSSNFGTLPIEFDVSMFAKGVYYIELSTQGKVLARSKLVVD